MSLPQSTWDIIRKDPRFIAATPEVQKFFILTARQCSWNRSPRSAAIIFRDGLNGTFGPLTAQRTQVQNVP